MPTLDVMSIRKDFPILSREVNGKPLIYLDNGATSQKPKQVIDAIANYYQQDNSNVHRGIHHLSAIATDQFEHVRKKISSYINANHDHEVIFTKGTTDGINLVTATYGKMNVGKGDEVIVSAMEHHSNIVPWQMLCEEKGAKLKVIPINLKGELIMEEYDELLSSKTKIVAVNHISNTLGTINPAREIINKAHHIGAKVLVDGAQAMPHQKVDMQALDADWYVFSAHKMFGPTGVGVLYGKEDILNNMPPYQGGGDMIKDVTFEKTTYNDLPHKLEAGTPNIAGVIGLGATVEYLNSLDFEQVNQHEKELLNYVTEQLKAIDGLQIIGNAQNKTSVLSFLVEGTHPSDLGAILDQFGIAIRTGHHCTQPLMDFYNIPGTARASFAFYNTKEEIDALKKGIVRALEMLL